MRRRRLRQWYRRRIRIFGRGRRARSRGARAFQVLGSVSRRLLVLKLVLLARVGDIGSGGRERYVECKSCGEKWWAPRWQKNACPDCGSDIYVD